MEDFFIANRELDEGRQEGSKDSSPVFAARFGLAAAKRCMASFLRMGCWHRVGTSVDERHFRRHFERRASTSAFTLLNRMVSHSADCILLHMRGLTFTVTGGLACTGIPD